MSTQPNDYKLYKFLAPEMGEERSICPKSVIIPMQLDTQLFKNSHVELGERVSTTFFASYDEENKIYSEPIVQFLYEFTRDESGLAIKRKRTVQWMLESGEWSDDTKVDYKYYHNREEQLNEVLNRRKNIISWLKGLAASIPQLKGAIGVLFQLFLAEIALYQESGNPALREQIRTTEHEALTWLDSPVPSGAGVTFRQYLVNIFSIGVNEP